MKALLKITVLLFAMAFLGSCDQPKDDGKAEAETKQKAMEAKMTAANDAVFASWNSGDAANMEANLTSDFTRMANGVPGAKNREEYIALMKMFKAAIPDLNFNYEVIAVTANKTLTKWTGKGTNTGMFGDQPATGKSSETHGFTILTYNEEGKAISEEAYIDQLSYLQAWGYTLVPPAAAPTVK